MKKVIFLLLLLISTKQYCQESDIEKLYDSKNYDAIVKLEISKESSAREIYYKAMAHYMKNDEDNCIKYMDIAIKKGPVVSNMHYYKGISYYFKKQYNDALASIKKAIELNQDDPYFYNGLGEIYTKINKLDSAYINYKKGSLLPKATYENFSSLGNTSFRLKKYDEALNAYNKAKELTKDKPEKQLFYLFNIGFIHQINKNYIRAENCFNEILKTHPDDYETITKLIQISIAQKKYSLAENYKQKLYKAYSDKKLPEHLNNRFCFEVFDWKEHTIFAYENYAEPEDSDSALFNKHQYYVYNEKEEYVCEVNSESSFAVRMHDGIKYVLALKNENGFQTFWKFGFAKTDYKTMKKNVLSILNQKVKPDASTSTIKK